MPWAQSISLPDLAKENAATNLRPRFLMHSWLTQQLVIS